MRQTGEPSVEEILASIKKVIARDSRGDAPRPAPKPAADVLDLGEVAAQVLRPEPEDTDTGEDEDSPLLNEATAAAMRDSLAALAMMAKPGARPQIVRQGETSLEGMVRDMLRPMLAEWLEQNLPAMVERMVAAEIARILHKQG